MNFEKTTSIPFSSCSNNSHFSFQTTTFHRSHIQKLILNAVNFYYWRRTNHRYLLCLWGYAVVLHTWNADEFLNYENQGRKVVKILKFLFQSATEGTSVEKHEFHSLYFHKLGTDSKDDVLVYDRRDQPDYMLWDFCAFYRKLMNFCTNEEDKNEW